MSPLFFPAREKTWNRPSEKYSVAWLRLPTESPGNLTRRISLDIKTLSDGRYRPLTETNDSYTHQMNKSDFSKLCERVQRSHDAVFRKASSGFVQSHELPDGSSTHLEIVGIKAPELLEDELLNLFIWLWSMKDYLKTLCATRGIAGSRIEQIANVERSLSIAADIANRAKHGLLRKSRSGDFAKLQNVRISIPQSAVASIAFERPTIRITVSIPDDAELFAEIGFDSGLAPVDAFQTASEAFRAWQSHAFPLAGV